jgi:hypothetical protein
MAALPVNNPRTILQARDSNLEKETRVVLFGRAALALGFGEHGEPFGATQDVDAILPTVEMTRIEADSQFWSAIEKTNKQLESSGLYLSHLFTDQQVILTRDWLEKVVPIGSAGYRFLRLLRPSSLDLILTKMMRNDPEDIRDIQFILRHDRINAAQLASALASAHQVDVPEIQGIFKKMQPLVLRLARELEPSRGDDRGRAGAGSVGKDWWDELTGGPRTHREPDRHQELEP